jgi:hypothetical protein
MINGPDTRRLLHHRSPLARSSADQPRALPAPFPPLEKGGPGGGWPLTRRAIDSNKSTVPDPFLNRALRRQESTAARILGTLFPPVNCRSRHVDVSLPFRDRNSVRKCNGELTLRSVAMLSAHDKK